MQIIPGTVGVIGKEFVKILNTLIMTAASFKTSLILHRTPKPMESGKLYNPIFNTIKANYP